MFNTLLEVRVKDIESACRISCFVWFLSLEHYGFDKFTKRVKDLLNRVEDEL